MVYAPYQKVPKARTKRDPREGTLERDADYQAFLERLQVGRGGAGRRPAGV